MEDRRGVVPLIERFIQGGAEAGNGGAFRLRAEAFVDDELAVEAVLTAVPA